MKSSPNGSSATTQLPKPVTGPLFAFVSAHRSHLVACAVAGLFLACVFRYWVNFDPNDKVAGHGQEMGRVAINVYEKGEFRDPYGALKTGPTAHLNPVYPSLLAAMMGLFGTQAAGIFAIKLMAVVAVASQVALFPLVSGRLGMGALNGFIAACIWIVAKPMLVYEWESSYAALLLVIIALIFRRYLDPDVRTVGPAWFLGALVGLLILILPTSALVLAVWLTWDVLHRDWRFIRARIVPLVVLPALIISPWLIRNYLVFHRLMLRDNLGLELGSANNDCAQFAVQLNTNSGCNIHPNEKVAEAQKILVMGEPQYNDMRKREAFEWIASHPARFMQLTGMRVVAFWFPTETWTFHHYTGRRKRERGLMYMMSLLSVGGVFILYRRDRVSCGLCIVCLTLFPIPYYITQFVFWHSYPVLWMIFLLGALPITALLNRSFPASLRFAASESR